jgi:NAD(P)-dependent dehydrogenase (short-subunit alcohol dehydrogenase family)
MKPPTVALATVSAARFGSDYRRSSPMNGEIIARTPAKRWGKSDEIIERPFFFRLGADFITGATLPVDAGYSVY